MRRTCSDAEAEGMDARGSGGMRGEWQLHMAAAREGEEARSVTSEARSGGRRAWNALSVECGGGELEGGTSAVEIEKLVDKTGG